MNDPNVIAAIEAAFTAFNERRFTDFAAYVSEDVVEEYPQSGERIEGRDRQLAFHEGFLNPPTFTVRRVMTDGYLAVAEVDEHYPDGSVWNDAFIFQFRAGGVSAMTGYFGMPFDAPEWRRPFRVRP